MADSESPSGASGCSVIEGPPRPPGTGGSSSGGVTSDGPSTPATEGISTTVLASPVTTPGFTPIAQHMINPMEVLVEGSNTGLMQQRVESVDRDESVECGSVLRQEGEDVTGTEEMSYQHNQSK